MNVIFTAKSRNAKTGPIPVTTSPSNTCPSACPLKANGCYAEHGPLGMLWRTMPNAVEWSAMTMQVAGLPQGQLWRHNQAGDLPHINQEIDGEAVSELVEANRGKRGFTYTHHDMAVGGNAAVVRDANAAGFTINLSANNVHEVDRLVALKIAPVVTMLPASIQGKQNIATEGGNAIVVCPATYRDDVTCATCKLCSVANRNVVVGFPAHGTAKRKASEVGERAAA